MKRLLLLFVAVGFLFIFYKLFVHSSCPGGSQGIPWWPNSSCSCKGFLINDKSNSIGGAAKYCIGLLEVNELNQSKNQDINQEKVKTLINNGCHRYFDGCNSCTGNSCTLMFCETYREPRCLD